MEEKNNSQINSVNYFEAGECSCGRDCPLQIIFDVKISPHQIAMDGKQEVIEHIRTQHNQYFQRLIPIFRLLQIARMNNFFDEIEQKFNFYNNIPNEIKQREGLLSVEDNSETIKKELQCPICKEDYDHTKYIMPCCDKHCCVKCIENKIKKENKCLFCGSKTDFLEDFNFENEEISKKSDPNKSYEKCNICFENLNETQYNAEYLIECKCNSGKGRKMCLSCSYNSIKDKKRVETFEIPGLPGVFRSNTIKIKGKCPYCNCENIKNKEDIIAIFESLPKRRK